ncbi:MAG: fibronectin type III domain-containing protein, partial [Prevotellaceae bacterium]|nr:fibronectin type III domain-containing protein [Prevotellaceae bacterium]
MKNHFLQKISLLVALLSTSLFSVNAATIWSSTGTDFTINRGTTVTFNALFGISEDWSGYTNLQITFEAGTQSGNSAGQATILKDGVNIFTADKMGSSNQFKAYTVTIGDAVDLAWGTSTNYNARLRNITITGDPGCANATTSFTDGNLVTKYASDVPFTNTFNSNNQSAQTWASSNPGVADVNQNGEVTLTGTVGTTVISVTQPVDATNAICAANASYTLEVTAAPELIFTPDPLPTLVYIEGQGPSAIATIYITGTNLPAGDVNIGPGNVWASLSPSGPFAYAGLTIENFAGGTLAPTPIYIQHPGTLPAGTYPDVAFIGAGIGASVNTERFFIPVVVSAPPTNPTLLVNPTQITGLDYVFGLGASAAQSFNVSGSLLDGTDITISAPVDFEVSLAQASGFATSVTIPGVSGTLASTPVYVRLAAGKAIGNYTLDIAVSGGGDVNSYVVAVSGAVTPAPLPAPTLGTPDTPTEEGFTAYWNAVAGAQGYIINVYQNGVLTTTVNATAAETSKVITGLNPSTTYTYKVIAVGDGVNNTNSPESVASAPSTTTV